MRGSVRVRMGSVVMLLSLAALAGCHRVYTETASLPPSMLNPDGFFQLKAGEGNITVSSWANSQVAIVAVKQVDVYSLLDISGLGADYTSRLSVSLSGDAKNLMAATKWNPPFMPIAAVMPSIKYDIRVPEGAIVEILAQNGTVSVSGNKRQVVVTDANGAITCDALEGELSAKSDNGGVTAVFAQPPAARARIYCESGRGPVDVTFPAQSAFDLNAHTGIGTITTDFSVPVTNNGSGQSCTGTVLGGGAQVDLIADDGPIALRAQQ